MKRVCHTCVYLKIDSLGAYFCGRITTQLQLCFYERDRGECGKDGKYYQDVNAAEFPESSTFLPDHLG